MPSPEQIIRAQRDEIETLREENRQLREALAPRIVVPRSWRLKTMEERLLRALRSAGPNALCEMRALHALYGEREETPDRGALYALICHLRRKLGEARTGIQIETLRDRGWRMTPESCAMFDAAVAADRARWDQQRSAA